MPDPMPSYEPEAHPEAVAAALAAFDRFLVAFNAYDHQGISEVLHYPHYRLQRGVLSVWQNAEEYLAGAKARIGPRWHHSVCDFRRPVAASPDKVHIDVQWTRFQEDGTPYLRFRALWVMACIDGRWAAQLRSSFEP